MTVTALFTRPCLLPRATVLEVLNETFDEVVDVTTPDEKQRPERVALDDALALARAAHDRDDVIELDERLRQLLTTAAIGRAQLRLEHPELGGRR